MKKEFEIIKLLNKEDNLEEISRIDVKDLPLDLDLSDILNYARSENTNNKILQILDKVVLGEKLNILEKALLVVALKCNKDALIENANNILTPNKLLVSSVAVALVVFVSVYTKTSLLLALSLLSGSFLLKKKNRQKT
jgi:hypothetical protein